MLWLGQKLKPGGWARRLFIITETSNKARQMNLKRKKASNSSFLVCSYCSVSPAAQWQGCGHQTWWEAEHSSVTHHREGQDEPPGPSPSPIAGLPTSTKHKKQRQRAETKQKASSTSAETDQVIFGPVQNASEVIDSFCKWLSLLKQGTSRSSVKLSKRRRWLLYFCTVNSAHSGNSKPFFFFLINLCSQKCVSWNCYCGVFFCQFYCNSRSILFSLNMRGWVGKLGETWTTYKFCIVSSVGNNNSFGSFQNPSPHGRTKAVPLCVLALQKWGKKLYSEH